MLGQALALLEYNKDLAGEDDVTETCSSFLGTRLTELGKLIGQVRYLISF